MNCFRDIVAKGLTLIALPVNGRYLAQSHSYIRRVKEEINILHVLERKEDHQNLSNLALELSSETRN